MQAIANFFSWLNSQEVLQQLVSSRFFLVLFVVFISSLKHYSYDSMFMAWIINILGTVFHETAHFVVGFILNARPVGFTLFPKKAGDIYVMGSVSFNNITFYNAVPSAMAPLLLLVLAFYVDKMFFNFIPLTLSSYLLFLLIMSILIDNSIPSPADFKSAASSPLGIVAYAILMCVLVFYCFCR